MDVDAAPVGQIVQVVDPEVRAYVYSLVTAVSDLYSSVTVVQLTVHSSVVSMVRMPQNIAWETMRWLVYAISRNGSNCTTKRPTAWT